MAPHTRKFDLMARWRWQIGRMLNNYIVDREKRKACYVAIAFMPSHAEDFSRFIPHNDLGYDESALSSIESILVAALYRVHCRNLDPPIRIVVSLLRMRFLSPAGNNRGTLMIGGNGGTLSQRDLICHPVRRPAVLPVVFSAISQQHLLRTALDMELAVDLAVDGQLETTSSLPGLETYMGFPPTCPVLPDFSKEIQELVLEKVRDGAYLPILCGQEGTVEISPESEDGFRLVSITNALSGMKTSIQIPDWVEWISGSDGKLEDGIYSIPFARLPKISADSFEELSRHFNMRSLDWLRMAVFSSAIKHRHVVLREHSRDHRGEHCNLVLKTVPLDLVSPIYYPKGKVLVNMRTFLGRSFPPHARPAEESDPFSSHIFVVDVGRPFPRSDDLIWKDSASRQIFDLSAVTTSGAWVLKAREEVSTTKPSHTLCQTAQALNGGSL